MASKAHYLREWRKRANMTLEAVALHAEMTHQNLGKIERFLVPYQQPLLDRLATLYGTSAAALLKPPPDVQRGDSPENPRDPSPHGGAAGAQRPIPKVQLIADGRGLGILPVRYKVAAGSLEPVDILASKPLGYVDVAPLANIGIEDQWLELVIGDSMDIMFAPGTLLHVVNRMGSEEPVDHDEVVIVQRWAFQGRDIERTVKQVELTPNGPRLWPRSRNPKWKPLTEKDLHDGGEESGVEIVGTVVRAYQFPPFGRRPNLKAFEFDQAADRHFDDELSQLPPAEWEELG